MSWEIGIFSGASALGTIPREALLKKMRSASAKTNIFLHAPGGYGKSVVAAQWLSSVRGKSARLVAGNADNDPGFFYKRLAGVLLKLTGTQSIPDTVISFDRLLEILRLLPPKSPRCRLVLDDLHVVGNEEVISKMPLIASRMPGYIRLCLVSRSEPTAAFMETGLFTVIAKDDLVFSPEEVEWLGAEKNRNLSEERIKELLEITGGWAMYLSALLSGGKAPDGAQKGKAPQSLKQYLEARVWGLWDRETRTLLLKLAVPAEVTPELCERLTGSADGRSVLEMLAQKGNAFLSLMDMDTYRFHDIFRDFLLEHIHGFFSKDAIRRLNDIAAKWYYEQADYLTGARYYIQNRDHEGINRCIDGPYRFHADTAAISVEVRLNFTKQYLMGLSPAFIAENPYLISRCAVAAFYNGETEDFTLYVDMLRRQMPEIASKYPGLMQTITFTFGLDFRTPFIACCRQIADSGTVTLNSAAQQAARVNSITQNIPFFHRSMRDYSEFHALNADDLQLFGDTYGVMIGRDYAVMGSLIIAGMLYERGRLLDATGHALDAYHACKDGMHPETFFSAYMILSAVLFAMGASQEADSFMKEMEALIERKAQFLRPNFRALQTERAIRRGRADAAREWLAVYANRSSRLPFYQICRHFATLRSHMAIKDYAAAAAFGTRLHTLAVEYKRPLDKIESGLLTALALWHNGKKNKSLKRLEQAVHVAMPYGFTQLFINEGREALPLLWELKKITGGTAGYRAFVDGLTDAIYKKHDLKPVEGKMPKLSGRQRAMLQYLNNGMTYNEIADAAALGHGTVKSHVLLLYKRLGVHNAQEAVVKAKMLGLLE